jgi:hypothetical protein
MRRALSLFFLGVYSLFLLEGVTLALYPLTPTIRDCTEFISDQQSVPRTLPFADLRSAASSREFRCTLHLPIPFFSSRFTTLLRDRFTAITVNGKDVTTFSAGVVSFPSSVLRTGENDVRFVVARDEHRPLLAFGIDPSLWSFSRLPLAVLALACFCGILWMCRQKYHTVFLSFLFVGGFLRIFLAYASPFYIRSYDASGHLQYILALLRDHAIPLVGSSWQAHQPPLYYLLTLPIAAFQALFFSPSHHISLLMLNVQHLSVFLSLLSLFLSLEIVLLLPFSLRIRSFLFAFLALFPGHLFFASQVNNDVLLFTLSLYWLLLLLRALHHPLSVRWCVGIGTLLSCAFLTKSNALPLLFLTLLFLFVRRSSLRHFCTSCLSLLSPFTAFLLPYYLLRFFRDQSLDVAYNAPFQGGTIVLHPRMSEIFSFHPLALLRFPVQDTMDAASRSPFFVESLIKTAHFGSTFPLDADHFLIFFLGMLALLACGFFRSFFSSLGRTWIVMFLTFLVAAIGFRLLYPYASAQHFRYIPLILFPCASFLGSALETCSRSLLLRAFSEVLFGLYIFLCGLYMASIVFSS